MMTATAADVRDGSVGATRSYLCPARDQLFLMPVSMRDWLECGVSEFATERSHFSTQR